MSIRTRLFGVLILLGALALVAQAPQAPGRRGAPGRGAAPAGRRGFAPAFPTPPPASPAEVAHGKQIFEANCSFCHGDDARGGETGPNLVRAEVVLDDRGGDKVGPILATGIPGTPMPKFNFDHADVVAIVDFLHAQPLAAPGGEVPVKDILVGNAEAGKAYFDGAGKCSTCHSVTGDLAGIGGKYQVRQLQNLIVSGGSNTGFGRGATPMHPIPPTTVTVTLPSGATVQGKLDHLDLFTVSLTESDGVYRSFSLEGVHPPTVTVHNPLQAHIDMLPHWNDTDIHNLTAYLATLK